MLETILILTILGCAMRTILYAMDSKQDAGLRVISTMLRSGWILLLFYYLIKFTPLFN